MLLFFNTMVTIISRGKKRKKNQMPPDVLLVINIVYVSSAMLMLS